MRKLMIAMLTAALTFGVGAAGENPSPYGVARTFTAEVYVNIPGNAAVHCPSAKITLLESAVVSVETPWGVTYTTHLSNVVIVVREGVEGAKK